MKSLTILIVMTMSSGIYIVGLPSEIEMAGTSCNSPTTKKYILAGFENCSMRLNNKNDVIWYLAVDILLLQRSISGTLVIIRLSGSSVHCGFFLKGFHTFCLWAFSYFMFIKYYHLNVMLLVVSAPLVYTVHSEQSR
jgi:hypothetical protein